MRVLMISWEYPPYVVGGMGKHVAELCPALCAVEGDETIYVDVLTPRVTGGRAIEIVNDYLTVHRVSIPPISPRDYYNSVIASNTALINAARKLRRKTPYDIIHVHDWSTATAGIALKHEWKTPLIATIHATERGRHQGYLPSDTSWQIDQLEWQMCFESWQLIICSRHMHAEVQAYFGVPHDKVRIIFNGLDVQSLHHCDEEERALLRQEYGGKDERLLFFVGRITHEKGLQVLVRAMIDILQKHPDVRLLAAGKNSERLLPLAQELGVEHAVDFLGFISDRERDHLYQTVDAAIFPSLYEPFGIVALEAMALNCNVIASDTGGLREVVRHDQNGLTVYPNDEKSIAWAVDQLFQNSAAAATRRQAARQEVEEEYNWPRIARRTADVYQEVVAERMQTAW